MGDSSCSECSREDGELSDELNNSDVIITGVENLDPSKCSISASERRRSKYKRHRSRNDSKHDSKLYNSSKRSSTAYERRGPLASTSGFWSKLRSSNTPKQQRERNVKSTPTTVNVRETTSASKSALVNLPPPPLPPLPVDPPPEDPPPPPLLLPPVKCDDVMSIVDSPNAASSVDEIDDDYIDKLLEQKAEIEQKLEEINRAEQLNDKDEEDIENRSFDEESQNDDDREEVEDEEDLDLLQLRLDALKSAAKTNKVDIPGLAESPTPEKTDECDDSDENDEHSSSGLSNTVLMCNGIPSQLNNRTLLSYHFKQFGKVSDVIPNPYRKKAVIHFEEHEAAQRAMKNGRKFKGYRLEIFWAKLEDTKPRAFDDRDGRKRTVEDRGSTKENKKRRIDDDKELKEKEEKLRRQEEKLQREKNRIERERERLRKESTSLSDRRRREMQRILTLDDPTEQFKRFEQLLKREGDPVNHRAAQNRSMSSVKSNLYSQKRKNEVEDNYEPVEMDLESQCSASPPIETEYFDDETFNNISIWPVEQNKMDVQSFIAESHKLWGCSSSMAEFYNPPPNYPLPNIPAYLPSQLSIPPPPPPLHNSCPDPSMPYEPPDADLEDPAYSQNSMNSRLFGATSTNIPGLDVDKHFNDLMEISQESTDVSDVFKHKSKTIPGLDLVEEGMQKTNVIETSPAKVVYKNNKDIPGLDLIIDESQSYIGHEYSPPISANRKENKDVETEESDIDLMLYGQPKSNQTGSSEIEIKTSKDEQQSGVEDDISRSASKKEETSIDEAELLRAQLLKNVLAKRKAKEEEKVHSEMTNVNEDSCPANNIVEEIEPTAPQENPSSPSSMLKNRILADLQGKSRSPSPFSLASVITEKKWPKLQIPQHNPVIVQLGESSSEDEEEKKPSESSKDPGMNSKDSLQSSIDIFLKQARAKAEEKQQSAENSLNTQTKTAKTPEAITKLGPDKVLEYRHLKESLIERQQHSRVSNNKHEIISEVSEEKAGDSRNITVDELGQLTATVQVQRDAPTKVSIELPHRTIGVENRSAVDSERREGERALVKYLQQKINAHKKMIAFNAASEDQIRSLLNKKRILLKNAEMKVNKLREQLSAADRVANAVSLQVAKLNQSAEMVGDKTKRMTAEVELMGKQLIVYGSRVYGKSFNPRRIVSDAAQGNASRSDVISSKKVAQSNRIQKVKSASKPSSRASSPKLQTKEERNVEKQRLQALEEKYRKMIDHYKDTQTKGSKARSKKETAAATAAIISQPEKVETEEVMSFSAFVEAEIEEENTKPCDPPNKQNTERRRLSSIGSNTAGTKPQLLSSPTGDSAGKSNKLLKSGDSNNDLKISIPSGKQLQNIRRLHRENVSKLSNVLEPLIVIPCDSGQLFRNHKALKPPLRSTAMAAQPPVVIENIINRVELRESDLKRFKAYRFSPYFRTKAGLRVTSTTFSNKIQPKKYMCRFGLTGKCNDDACPWQHESDFTMSEDEILQDLVAYTPGLAGITPESPLNEYQNMISSYVAEFQKQNAKMPHSQQCILLTSLVNKYAKHDSALKIFTEARRWKPIQSMMKSLYQENDNIDQMKRSHFSQPDLSLKSYVSDDILDDEDIRYWMKSTDDLKAMETAVFENPNNVDGWLKLAYKKLNSTRSNAADRLDEALELLSRALEANRHSSELWIHYLKLYSTREGVDDLLDGYQQALLYAPSYELHWKYLTLLPTYKEKALQAKATWQFAASQKEILHSVRSHQILEAVLYSVSIASLSGRMKTAVTLIQNAIKTNLLRYFTWSDRVIAHLCYIHLAEFHRLPRSLFDPGCSNPGRIVNKEVFLFPWIMERGTKLGFSKLETLFLSSINTCTRKTDAENIRKNHFKIMWPLYLNFIQLYEAHKKYEEAIQLCENLKSQNPHFDDLWIKLAHLQQHHHGDKLVEQVLEEATSNNSHSHHLHNVLAVHLKETGHFHEAKACLANAIKNNFDLSENAIEPSAEMLYKQLIGLALPIGQEKAIVTRAVQLTHDDHLYAWLNLGLLLELDKRNEDVEELYETALCKLTVPKHIQITWLRYLQFAYEADCETKLATLVNRCLSSSPAKSAVVQNAQHFWLDYGFHNQVIDFYLRCLDESDVKEVLLSYVRKMPANINLVLRLLDHLIKEGDFVVGRGTSLMALQEHPSSLALWKVHIYLCSKEEDYYQMSRSYRRAVSQVPFAVSIWKNFLLYEMSYGSESSFHNLLDDCLPLVNIRDFLATILGVSSNTHNKNVNAS